MPNGRKYNARRPVRRRNNKKRTAIPRRALVPMQQKVMRFKRDVEQQLVISSSSPPEGWSASGNRIYTTLAYSLGSVGESTDFTALFRQYRLKGARVRLFFSNTQSTVEQDSTFSNSQILVRMAPNQRGEADVGDNAYWQSVMAKKYKLALNGGRPLDIYMPLKQRNEVTSSTGSVTSTMAPKFISTGNTNVVHYGLNLSLERVDGDSFTSGMNNNQHCKVITTLYFECKGIE